MQVPDLTLPTELFIRWYPSLEDRSWKLIRSEWGMQGKFGLFLNFNMPLSLISSTVDCFSISKAIGSCCSRIKWDIVAIVPSMKVWILAFLDVLQCFCLEPLLFTVLWWQLINSYASLLHLNIVLVEHVVSPSSQSVTVSLCAARFVFDKGGGNLIGVSSVFVIKLKITSKFISSHALSICWLKPVEV